MERFKHMISLLLLLAYVGQSLAVVGAPCSMPDAGAMSAVMDSVDHSAHHEQPGGADSGGGCCDGGGFCSMSHCQSVAALPPSDLFSGVATATNYRESLSLLSPDNTPDSLYRPPASR